MNNHIDWRPDRGLDKSAESMGSDCLAMNIDARKANESRDNCLTGFGGWQYSDAWCAGFFDGEGCISIHRRDRGCSIAFQIVVQVSQNDRRPLDAIAFRFGGTVTPSQNGYDRCHRWRTSFHKAEVFIRAIRPHLLVKAAEADIALDLMSLTTSGGRVPPENAAARLAAYAAFLDLKGR